MRSSSVMRAVAAAFRLPLFVLSLGLFTGATAAQQLKVEDLSEMTGEINQLCQGAHTFLEDKEIVRAYVDAHLRNECSIIVYGLTREALADAIVTNVAKTAFKNIKDGLKGLAEAVADPEEGIEKVGEAIIKAAKKEAKNRLKKKIKKYFDDNPTIFKYTRSGKVGDCTYTMLVTWNTKDATFSIRTSGDCKCEEISYTMVGKKFSSKIKEWQSLIEGKVTIDDKVGVDGFVQGLQTDKIKYSGAGACNCNEKP